MSHATLYISLDKLPIRGNVCVGSHARTLFTLVLENPIIISAKNNPLPNMDPSKRGCFAIIATLGVPVYSKDVVGRCIKEQY